MDDDTAAKKLSSEAQFLAKLKVIDMEKYAAIRSRKKSKTEVRREVNRAEVLEKVQLPAEKFRIIYADPPWKYGDGLTENYGATGYHYPSMSILELCLLPVFEMVEGGSPRTRSGRIAPCRSTRTGAVRGREARADREVAS